MPTPSPSPEDLRAEVRDFLQQNDGPAAGAAPSPEVIRWHKVLLDAGFVGRFVPREYGGHGFPDDLGAQRVLHEEFTRARVSKGLENQGIKMLIPTLLAHASEAQKRDLIPPTLRGEILWCQGYSEPGAGSDLASLRSRASRDGEHFVVNGHKIWTSDADRADMMFALLRTSSGDRPHQGISYILLDMKSPGIEVRPLKTIAGETLFSEVFFEDVKVPVQNLVGREGDGWKIGMATLRHERMLLGNPQLTDLYLQECAELIRGGEAHHSPGIRDRFVRLHARYRALAANYERVVREVQSDDSMSIGELLFKLTGTALNHEIAELALEALDHVSDASQGGAEALWRHRYLETLGITIGGGTMEIQKNIISERGLGMPKEPRG
jgi:alkylation response protein AidB-like acyl-CoA dehydrogenase